MDESEESMSAEYIKSIDGLLTGTTKVKKRSIIERELETSLTAKVTSPATSEGTGTSRYGRTLRLKTELQNSDKKLIIGRKSPVKTQSPVYKMHASNSPLKSESNTTSADNFLENQIDNIYLENISLSRFGSDEVMNTPPAKKFSKVYTRKDLIQTRDAEENVMLIKNKFSPAKSGKKHASHLNNILERSAEECNLSSPGKAQNGYRDNSSVVKTLDFDSKKKKDNKESRTILSISDLFNLEAQCMYQVGDLAWARMGTYPFWPCIVTRDPTDGIFVKKKLFGRVERDIVHVTFFGDNGRRGWIVDTMLRKYRGRQEFDSTRNNFTPEDKKKDPRLYAAYFVSEKKQTLWNASIQEAEMLLREPKRLRIDIFNDMLIKSRNFRAKQRSGKISRTSSDVSLSESLYDSLFSEDDAKSENTDRSRNIAKNKSLDVSDVVTACLDNMAAKSGITKIQKQSHMDRWLQKAKSKTPEKIQVPIKIEKDTKVGIKKKKKTPCKETTIQNVYSLRRSVYESQNLLQFENEHDYSGNMECVIDDSKDTNHNSVQPSSGIGIIVKVESLNDKVQRNQEVPNRDTTEEPKNVVCENYTSHLIDSTEYNVQDINNKIDVNANTDSSSIIKEPIIGSEKIDLKRKCEIVSPLCDGDEINATKECIQEKNSQDSQKILNQRDIEEATQYCTKDCDIEANLNEGTVEKTIRLKNTNNNIQNELCNVPKDINVTKNRIKVCYSVELAECNIQDKKESDVIANKHPSGGTKKSVSKNSQKRDLSTERLKPELVSPHITDYETNKNVTKNQNMEKINQDDKQKLLNQQFINETMQNCLKDSDINVETNVQTDYDSDSDIQLPYSPLSVNLNKDESSIEELDEIIEDKHLNDFYEPEMATKFKKENEREKEILNYDVDKTIINNLNPKQPKNSFDKNEKHESQSKKLPAVDVRKLTEQKSCRNSINHQKSYDNKDHDLTDQQKIIGDKNMSNNSFIDVHVTENQKDLSKTEPTKVSIEISEIASKDVVIKIKHDKKERNKTEQVNSNKVIRNIKHKENRTILNDSNVVKEECNVTKEECTVTKGEINILGIEIKNKYTTLGNEDSNINVNEVMTKMHDHTVTCIPDSIKVNGFCGSNSYLNKDFNIEMSSTQSDDITITKSENSRKLRSKVKNTENPLNDLNFMKYLELRQDVIMDENPELTYDEVVAYSLKTWLYEETLKNETKKKEDSLYQSSVKGPNKNSTQIDPKKKLRLKKTNKLNSSPMQKSNRDDSLDDHSHKTLLKDNTVINSVINVEPVIVNSEIVTTDNTKFENIQERTSYSPNSSNIVLKENDADAMLNTPHNSFLDENNDDTINSKGTKGKDVSVNNSRDTEREKHKESTNHQSELKKEDVQNNDFTEHQDYDAVFKDLEDSEMSLIKCKLRSMNSSIKDCKGINVGNNIKNEIETDRISNNSEDIEVSIARIKKNKTIKARRDNPEFIKYLELRQDALLDENPQLTHDEIVLYLYQTWLYEENAKSDLKKSEEIVQSKLVKGFNDNAHPPKNIKLNKIKTEKELVENNVSHKEKPKRKSIKPYYNEEYSDLEEELDYFEIFKSKDKNIEPKVEADKISGDKSVHTQSTLEGKEHTVEEKYNLAEFYFKQLTKPKPNIFKGLIREKVCEICENTDNLVKCKGCNGMFHMDCIKKETEIVEVHVPTRGRKKKKKVGRKPKIHEDTETHEDGSEDQNVSIEEIIETESHTVDADAFEALLTAKMKEMIENSSLQYDSYSSDDGLDWSETVPGKCEIVDIKHKQEDSQINFTNYKCNNCQKYDTPICFVCKSAVSKNDCRIRQKCHIAHCYKYYHLECLNHWPQTQFNGGVPSKNNKKINEHFEALTCPRHVCHTCVSDDPRGCKTRFSGDKLARCVRCPATYHSFMKCLPAGTQILTASHIICPRHYQHRPGKMPCHVNTGWCFICALGGSLICCEYCPTSFHAECLNIKPPEGGYMCEDCETGRLPLYGEMVWVKLGHYRWWPGMILHPTEIPENILAVKHSRGEFVVRFFGQYDHYWTNRGRVFPFQEGDSGRISSHKSKIDAAFITAIEHAQRACEILKSAQPNDEESLDIASSLLPPHYVKLKVNKPCGSLCGRRLEDPESSFTQCECNPLDEDPCGPYSHCLNRMLLTECGPTCRAGDRCNNRAFEKRLYPKLVPYRTPTRGWGLKTLEDIKAGQFVIEYVGELIDEEEFRRRMRRKFEIRDENFYFLTLDKERMIDAGPKGNLARFMNHCCEPNCETQKWTVLGDVRVGLFAIHDIPANSEVTFNYNLECAGIEKKQCMCGAKRCSGYIGAKPKQDESLLKKNKLLPKRTYKKRKPIEESPSSSKSKPKRPLGRPPKPKELTEIEKDLLIIKSATNGVSSDESSRSLSVEYDRHPKALKRKRVSFSTEDVTLCNSSGSPKVKKHKPDLRKPSVGD